MRSTEAAELVFSVLRRAEPHLLSDRPEGREEGPAAGLEGPLLGEFLMTLRTASIFRFQTPQPKLEIDRRMVIASCAAEEEAGQGEWCSGLLYEGALAMVQASGKQSGK